MDSTSLSPFGFLSFGYLPLVICVTKVFTYTVSVGVQGIYPRWLTLPHDGCTGNIPQMVREDVLTRSERLMKCEQLWNAWFTFAQLKSI